MFSPSPRLRTRVAAVLAAVCAASLVLMPSAAASPGSGSGHGHGPGHGGKPGHPGKPHKPGHPGKGQTASITVMGTSDLHGYIENWDYFQNAEYDDAAGNDVGLA